MADDLSTALRLFLAGLSFAERELLLFAAFWFVVGTIDELAVDLIWAWLRLTGRAADGSLPEGAEALPLLGRAAVFVPAWQESQVLGAMIAHTLAAWRQRDFILYVGCYPNDPDTAAAARGGAGGDPRVRIVLHDRDGPTTKADCLNRLYRAMCDDEAACGEPFANVILHDAEDMVHPAALHVIDRALAECDFVQLPVRPEPQARSHLVAGHYTDEFAEAHAKTMVVRDAVGAAVPAAGVGCGFSRAALARLAEGGALAADGAGPFASDSLTEDYELGLAVSRRGRGGRFIRLRDHTGALVATRAYFPASLVASVRQKTRWIHGIAFQGWDRLGWSGRPVDIWMALRDRRGPLTALVLAVAYGLIVIEAVLGVARLFDLVEPADLSLALRIALPISFFGFVWRAAWRFGFTAQEHGAAEGVRSVLRVPVANIIAIMAARRAFVAYVRSLSGAGVRWDKTHHADHPAIAASAGPAQ